ncbi:MAG TPA: Na+ dependent nucleoside transporter N-terminal domain-containing protein, partial [Candidatus Aminicenantes bacterium]|nr:Na+ dependent nucleoside transporter N-terminal domain-containing protein [Candidatus Aminicenantes bacterium]
MFWIAMGRGILGVLLILSIAFLFSENRRRISWTLVGKGLAIQLTFAIFILYSETLRSWFGPLGWLKDSINWLGGAVVALLGFTMQG